MRLLDGRDGRRRGRLARHARGGRGARGRAFARRPGRAGAGPAASGGGPEPRPRLDPRRGRRLAPRGPRVVGAHAVSDRAGRFHEGDPPLAGGAAVLPECREGAGDDPLRRVGFLAAGPQGLRAAGPRRRRARRAAPRRRDPGPDPGPRRRARPGQPAPCRASSPSGSPTLAWSSCRGSGTCPTSRTAPVFAGRSANSSGEPMLGSAGRLPAPPACRDVLRPGPVGATL